ncbi:MAG: Wzz/FepE/Etk N-terminal domain-containing protein, partial [Candidatus Neomarinimicrobiota bacterium]|nr:Wzz/FepE/Etk N-terminal domain-containing protein [Candidatus Neomarinimicrobiota bacterium]
MQANNKKQESVAEIILKVMQRFQYRHQYQVAKFFNVTAQTLSGWIKSNSIPPKHLIKYKQEIELVTNEIPATKNREVFVLESSHHSDTAAAQANNFQYKKISVSSIFNLLKKSKRTLIFSPFVLVSIVSVYVFFLAPRVYTSSAKILPISENNSKLSNLSGLASQFGMNLPTTVGSEIQWDELYPEIVRSERLMEILVQKSFQTEKYPDEQILLQLLDIENNYRDESSKLKLAVEDLKEMIIVQKDRFSPVVSLHVEAFEPRLARDLATEVIAESGKILLDLKTKKVQEKRIFIEARIEEVFNALQEAEKAEEQFRLENKNIIQSPTLTMKIKRLFREVELQNSLYVSLKSQYENAKIEEVQEAAMIQVIDGPLKPVRLTSPR